MMPFSVMMLVTRFGGVTSTCSEKAKGGFVVMGTPARVGTGVGTKPWRMPMRARSLLPRSSLRTNLCVSARA